MTTTTPVAGLTTRPTTGTNRYIPAHGTESRYRGAHNGSWPRCRCNVCVAAHTRACKRRGLERLSGHPPLYPGGPLIQHIKTLNEAGMSNELIARRARVASSTISYLVRGLTKSCLREKALRILAVQPGDFDERAERPSAGSRRRLQALYAIGHNPETISAKTGMAPSAISSITNGHTRQIDAPSAMAIEKAYDLLRNVKGASVKARRRAAQMGWRDPLWWEDMGHLDDPNFNPATAEQELNRDELAKLRREEIEHLASYGFEAEAIADRLNLHISTVRAILHELRTGQRRDRGAAA